MNVSRGKAMHALLWPKIISGDVRESTQPTTMAKGCCACAVSASSRRRLAFRDFAVIKTGIAFIEFSESGIRANGRSWMVCGNTRAVGLNRAMDVISVSLHMMFMLVRSLWPLQGANASGM